MNNIGPLSLISYFSFTLIFFIVKNKFFGKGIIWIFAFLIITGIIQFVNNLSLTNSICGSYSVPNAFFATVVPWVFIFGITCCCLVLIPGWLRVFSNTFGVAVANMGGLKEAVTDMFGETSSITENDVELKKTIDLLYSSKNQYINEVELDYTYDETNNKVTWDSLDNLLKFMKIAPTPDDTKLKMNLYKKLSIKEDVGYFMWFVLIGSISILVSTNSLLVSKCGTADFG
jgi:hypothetical protein